MVANVNGARPMRTPELSLCCKYNLEVVRVGRRWRIAVRIGSQQAELFPSGGEVDILIILTGFLMEPRFLDQSNGIIPSAC